jgi:protoporphyrinogen oxidase
VKKGRGWRVNGEEFDLVVSTLPLTDLPDVVKDVPPAVAQAMRGLEYNGLICVLIALDRAAHPDLSWVYLPHEIQGPANRVTYMSNYGPGNAPPGKSSFLCEVTLAGGARAAGSLPGSDLEEQVIAGLVHAGLLEKKEILFHDRSAVKHAYVVFDHSYAARRKSALTWMESAGILPLGRFGRFEYDNSDQCVIKARALAARILKRAAQGS